MLESKSAVVSAAMLLVEPREAAGPPSLPMSALTKLNFTDYSVKVKPYDEDNRLNYEQSLGVSRLAYDDTSSGSHKIQYDQRIAFETVDNVCQEPSYVLPGQLIHSHPRIYLMMYPNVKYESTFAKF